MKKKFDDLTIADDFMFCKVMQNEAICKEFLEIILKDKIGKITYLAPQNTVATGIEAKSVRLDLLIKDETGKSYDIEMQISNEYNIPKRMRYYQAAIDIAFLDKGAHYKILNDCYIIFICLFDAVGKDKPLYTFENMCLEDKETLLQDGTKKIIINAEAFNKAESADMKGFLEYLKTGTPNTEYTGRIETMIQTVKKSEAARQEYRFMSAFEMDAREEGFSEGAHRKALETAKNLLDLGLSIENIAQATGLSEADIKTL